MINQFSAIPIWNPRSSGQAKSRFTGLILILVGGLAEKILVFDLLDSLRKHLQPTLEYDFHIVVVPVFIMLIGLRLLIFGNKFSANLTGQDRRLSKTGWLLVLLMVVPAIMADNWFESQLRKLGYTKIGVRLH